MKEIKRNSQSKLFLMFISSVSLMSCSTTSHKGPISDHFDGKKFFNPGINNEKSFFTFLKWQSTRKAKDWPKAVENKFSFEPQKEIDSNKINVTFVNHATFLIRWKGFNILTDPVWSERVSPVSFAGPKRVRPPGVKFEDLPKIDLVVVSHNHYDHMDMSTLKQLRDSFDPEFRVPLGDKLLLQNIGIEKVKEMDWQQSETFVRYGRILELTFVPAVHWSGRGLFDRFQSLWGGFVFSMEGQNVLYAGDTGYSEHFRKLKTQFNQFDLAFLPIGAYEPRWFMKENHMNPEDAVQAHIDLGQPPSLGMHFGTFPLTDEGLDDPRIALKKVCDAQNISYSQMHDPDEGKSYEF